RPARPSCRDDGALKGVFAPTGPGDDGKTEIAGEAQGRIQGKSQPPPGWLAKPIDLDTRAAMANGATEQIQCTGLLPCAIFAGAGAGCAYDPAAPCDDGGEQVAVLAADQVQVRIEGPNGVRQGRAPDAGIADQCTMPGQRLAVLEFCCAEQDAAAPVHRDV